MRSEDETRDEISSRMLAGLIAGFMAMWLGLVFALSQASEADAWPMGVSAAVVLIHMVGGYTLGWLALPLLSRIFPGS